MALGYPNAMGLKSRLTRSHAERDKEI